MGSSPAGRPPPVVPLLVYAHTVRVGDVLRQDGISRTVADLRTLPGGRKHVVFCDGRTLVLGHTTSLKALRPCPLPDR